jgi:pantoate--beta-alanine ligase
MKILLNNNDLNEALNNVSKLGFVPTMGSFHKGHISLIKKSKKECNKTIVSIFVNPNQFNNRKDFEKYPRNIKKDISILKNLKVNFVYLPSKKHVYHSKRSSKIKLNKKDQILCAKFRKGHFEGVIDVMDRLTNLIKPWKIYMGEKDMQQLHLVKNYIKKKYKSKIISCQTIRDKKGLALSSRNSLLNNKQIKKARNLTSHIFHLKKRLKNKKNIYKLLQQKKNDLSKLFDVKVEYLELRNANNLKISSKTQGSKIFIAYFLNNVRLIDNI